MDTILFFVAWIVFIVLVLSFIRSRAGKKSIEMGMLEAEEVLLSCSAVKFEKAISVTGHDRTSGFLPEHSGESRFLSLRRTSGSPNTHLGVWMLTDDRILKIFFLAYDRGARWILDLGNDPRLYPDRISKIARNGDSKHIEYLDGNQGIWREVRNGEDMLW